VSDAAAFRKPKRLLTNFLTAAALVLVGTLLVQQVSSDPPTGSDKNRTIRVGWEPHYPYQFETGDGGMSRPSGLDTELIREAFRRAGYQVEFVLMDWPTTVRRLEEGTIDAGGMAFWSKPREEFAYFSEPFFSMRSALFHRRGELEDIPGEVPELRERIVKEKLSLGSSRGHAYVPELLALVDDQQVENKAFLHDSVSLNELVQGTVDVVIADQLGGTSTVIKNGWRERIECTLLDVEPQAAHLMFSRKAVGLDVVQDFNRALRAMSDDGTSGGIVRGYYYPTMLSMLAQTFWFDEISLLAVGAAAVSGIFLARKVGTNLVGAFLLAACPAAGGGLLRDLVAGRRPVAIVESPSILLLVVFLVLFAFLVFRIVDYRAPKISERLDHIDIDSHPVLVFFDGLGLAAFTVVGVLVAMKWHCEPLWLWGPLLAAMTNGGGSGLRDVILRRDVGLVYSTLPYVEVSILWGWLLSCFLTYSSDRLVFSVFELQVAIVVTLLGVGLTYMALRLSGVRSLTYGVVRVHSLDPPADSEE
jgi:polar amino acid transport system substrate-binding protein